MNQFSGKVTLPYLLEQGMQKRLWKGDIIDIKLITKDLIIIVSSAGAELFDLNTNKTLWEIDCPTRDAIISPNFKFLVTPFNYKIYIWDLHKGKLLNEVKPRWRTSNIAFSPDSQTITFGELDGCLSFYNLITERYETKTVAEQDINHITFSPSGDLVALFSQQDTIKIEICDVESTKRVRSIEIRTEIEEVIAEFDIVYTPDNQYIIYANGRTQKVYIYDIESGEQFQVLENYTDNPDEIAGGLCDNIAISFSEDGTLFAIGNCDKKIKLWNFNTKEYLDTITVSKSSKTNFYIKNISFDPNNNSLASVDSDNQITIWNIKNQKKVLTKQYRKNFSRLILSPNNQIFASIDCEGIFEEISLWDFSYGQQLKKIPTNQYITNIAFNSKATKLITSCSDDSIKIWDIESGREIFTLIAVFT